MIDDPLRHSKADLRSAARAIEIMKASDSFEAFESEWRVFLTCLEKVWAKVERACQPHKNAFQPWQGQFQALRKKDMLLRYLKQARDADNHSIQDVAVIVPGRSTINFLNPKGGYIKHLRISNGQVTHYEGDPIVQTSTSPHAVAVAVKNNGNWYNPPTTHLDKAIPDQHPITLAELGLKFYGDYLTKVEQIFFKTTNKQITTDN